MRFHIPFTLSDIEKLKRKRRWFNFRIKQDKLKKLQQYLNNVDANIDANDYILICTETLIPAFLISFVFASTVLYIAGARLPFLYSFGLAILFSAFIFFSQLIYPKVYDSRRIKNIERNLIPALQDMFVQLNSGIPLFNILINISSSDYGFLSEEFKKGVRKISSGVSEVEVLEELGEKNSSSFFKRTLWQLSNGMKAGSDISTIIGEGIKMLNEELIEEIDWNGNKIAVHPKSKLKEKMFVHKVSLVIPN